jgi:hypothetical protein
MVFMEANNAAGDLVGGPGGHCPVDAVWIDKLKRAAGPQLSFQLKG